MSSCACGFAGVPWLHSLLVCTHVVLRAWRLQAKRAPRTPPLLGGPDQSVHGSNASMSSRSEHKMPHRAHTMPLSGPGSISIWMAT